MAQIKVLLNIADVLPAYDSLDDLRVSGLSLSTLSVHVCEPAAVRRALDEGQLQEILKPTSYRDRLRPGSGVLYTEAIPVARDVMDTLVDHHRRNVARPAANVIWIEDSPLVTMVLPIRSQIRNLRTLTGTELEFWPHLQFDNPINLSELLTLVIGVTGALFQTARTAAAAEALRTRGIEATRSYPIDSKVGIDIWSLAGTRNRPIEQKFSPSVDCARYSVAIAALLSYTSDHVANRFYRNLSAEAVFAEVAEARCFMDDHAIYCNPSACLEMTHFGDWAPSRSWDRLQYYGFDSSSLYLWAIALSRNECYRHLSETAGRAINVLTSRGDVERPELDRLTAEALEASKVHDRLVGIHMSMKESRGREIDEYFARIFEDSTPAKIAAARLEAQRQLSISMRERNEDSARQGSVARLTWAAAFIALAAVPGATEQVWLWLAGDQRLKLGFALSVVLIVVAVTVRELRLTSPKLRKDRRGSLDA